LHAWERASGKKDKDSVLAARQSMANDIANEDFQGVCEQVSRGAMTQLPGIRRRGLGLAASLRRP
jgi:hypothetical protein